MKAFILIVISSCVFACMGKPAPEPPLDSYFPPSAGGGGHGGGGNGGGGNGGGGNGGGGGYPPSSSYGAPPQRSVIHKHVYVHVPPPETPEYKPPKYLPPASPPQKHYKIVFIKAPTPPTPTAPALPPLPPQDEQKTLIYVLVKKPEETPEIEIPTPSPTQPSKPEVYFIRYKTQKEQQTGEYGAPPVPQDSYGTPQRPNGGPY